MGIEKLKKRDIAEVVKVYLKGIKMENPPGEYLTEKNKENLEKGNCFVYKEGKKILGLIEFTINKNNKIRIDFICSIKLRRGIGKKLIKKLADFAIKNNIKSIYTTMSSKDKRAMNFYKTCGFKKFGRYSSYNLIVHRIKIKPEDLLDI